MKKNILRIVLLAVLLMVLTACSNTQNNSEESQSAASDTNAKLKVGMELKWPPFEMTTADGKADGISVLIANELGAYLGREVEIVDLAFSSMIPALETEKIDLVISSMSITEERKEKINFSEPYMYFKLLAAVNKDSKLKTRNDVFTREGLRFVAPKSFSSLALAREKANNPQILEFDDKATASLELANGNADLFIVDAVTAVGISKTYPDKVEVIYDPIESSPIGMGMRKSDTELLTKVNEFISKLDELGVNDKIREKYNDVLMENVGKTYEFYLNEN